MKLKKIAIAALAAITMATSAMGVTASALTPDHIKTDNYSEFAWGLSGTEAAVRLKNTSGTSRYASVYIGGYDAGGNYAGGLGNSGVISNGSSVSKSGYLYTTATSASFSGTLYTAQTPYGDPLSSWYRTLG